MNHCFNLGIANEFDPNIAIFIQSIAYWTHNNLTNKRNLIDGHCWSFNTLEALCETFTYWSKRQLETVIKNAIKSGLLIKGNHNQTKYDRTCWYALSHDAYRFFPELCQEHFIKRLYDSISPNCEMEYAEWRNRFTQNVTPIPTTKTITKSNTITNSESVDSPAAAATGAPAKKSKPNLALLQLIDVYRDVFPDNPQPHPRVIATNLQKTLSTLVKRWPELDPNGNPLTLETFRTYLQMLRDKAPKFSLGEYITDNGNKKKNNLETFTRWNTVVKFLENQYS